MSSAGTKPNHSPRIRGLTFIVVIAVLLYTSTRTSAFSDLSFLGLPWCAKRPPGQDCCTGRDDLCSVPIFGTECYCDVFCNKTANDCCPDYASHCLGLKSPVTTPRPTTLPPPRTTRAYLRRCYKEGRAYEVGDVITDNCKKCTCEEFPGPSQRFEWRCNDDVCLVRPELIAAINDGPYTWKAGNYSQLWGLTLDQGTRYRLGTFKLPENVLKMTALRVLQESLPGSFDGRVHWRGKLSPITDQGNCGSSWAHSTTAVASDRLNIETDPISTNRLSVQHLLSCDTNGQFGCNGGHLDRAWWYIRKLGLVNEDCYPFVPGQPNDPGICLLPNSNKTVVCPSGEKTKREKRLRSTPPYRIQPLEREIMKEIIDNGPVQVTIHVREDFFVYKRGVYRYTDLVRKRNEPEQYLKSGFHSVRIIGWGVEPTAQGDIIKYWICANSWGPEWGEDGYFRILRGSDESSIESFVIGVWGWIEGDSNQKGPLAQRRKRKLNGQSETGSVEKLRRKRKRRHNLNKIDSFQDDDFTTGRKYRYFKPKNRKKKAKISKKGKKYKMLKAKSS